MFRYKLSLKKISKYIEEKYDDVLCVFSPPWKNQIDIFISEEIYEDIEDFIPSLKKMKISGIDNIKTVNYRPKDKKKDNKWHIITHGLGSFDELISLDYIDKNTIISNNIWDIYKTFGIEAARQFLIDEFISVISSDGTYINKRHVMIMVDIMTYTGNITSISRYGINRKESGVFAKASFEESLDNFLKAAVFTDKEAN